MKHYSILISSDSYYPHPGGVSEYMHFLAKSLRKLGNKVSILAPSYPVPYNDDADTKRIGKCYLFHANKATITLTLHPKLPFLVRDFIKQGHFDIVHTNGPLGWNLPYWAFHYSKAINIVTFHTAFTGPNLYQYAKLIFKHEFKQKMHGAIYPSLTARDTTFPHFPMPYRIIPNGVDTERFSPQVKPLDKFPKELPKILFLGRLDPRKGLDHLITAFPKVKKIIPEAILIIVGSGTLLDRYQQMLPEKFRSSVYFEGHVPADMIPRYYASCDVFVSPATGGEVFGIVLTEAMSSGRPVVASDIPGYNQVIEHDVNGLLFNVNDQHDIVEKITRVLKDKNLKERLTKQGLKFAQQVSWLNIARKVMDFYHDVSYKFTLA